MQSVNSCALLQLPAAPVHKILAELPSDDHRAVACASRSLRHAVEDFRPAFALAQALQLPKSADTLHQHLEARSPTLSHRLLWQNLTENIRNFGLDRTFSVNAAAKHFDAVMVAFHNAHQHALQLEIEQCVVSLRSARDQSTQLGMDPSYAATLITETKMHAYTELLQHAARTAGERRFPDLLYFDLLSKAGNCQVRFSKPPAYVAFARLLAQRWANMARRSPVELNRAMAANSYRVAAREGHMRPDPGIETILDQLVARSMVNDNFFYPPPAEERFAGEQALTDLKLFV